MGLSSGLEQAAKNLKTDIKNGVDIKKAILAFADKIETIAKIAEIETQKILKGEIENGKV